MEEFLEFYSKGLESSLEYVNNVKDLLTLQMQATKPAIQYVRLLKKIVNDLEVQDEEKDFLSEPTPETTIH